MKPTQNNISLFLLSLYAIIVLHGSIAHPYDSELGNALCRISPSGVRGIFPPPEGICENDVHFNILSDEFQANIKKTDIAPNVFVQAGQPPFSLIPARNRPQTPYQFRQTSSQPAFFFCLRSPPLA